MHLNPTTSASGRRAQIGSEQLFHQAFCLHIPVPPFDGGNSSPPEQIASEMFLNQTGVKDQDTQLIKISAYGWYSVLHDTCLTSLYKFMWSTQELSYGKDADDHNCSLEKEALKSH